MIMIPKLKPMTPGHIEGAVTIMELASSEQLEVGAHSEAVFRRHFRMKELGIDDGRRFFVWLEEEDIAGITGLHQYAWGPGDNVWLSFFGVHPDFQGLGIGAAMLRETESIARKKFRRFFIETKGRNHRAHQFYSKHGFRETGMIANYNEDGSPMLVFLKMLDPEIPG